MTGIEWVKKKEEMILRSIRYTKETMVFIMEQENAVEYLVGRLKGHTSSADADAHAEWLDREKKHLEGRMKDCREHLEMFRKDLAAAKQIISFLEGQSDNADAL